jgi:hypothetical protein
MTGRTDHPTRQGALTDALAAYGTSTDQILTAVADQLGLSLAYIDRHTVEAHVDRRLSDAEWTAVTREFSGLSFDEHMAAQSRADWIDAALFRADVAGPGDTHLQPAAHPHRRPG